jgi:O-antigen ligase
MYSSVFFTRMRPFWTPGRFTPQTHLMLWLLLVLVVVLVIWRDRGDGRLGVFGERRVLPEEGLLALFAVLIGIHVFGVFDTTGDLYGAVTAAMDSLYLVLGYLMIRGIVSRATPAETLSFLRAVVLVNTFVAGLFILHQGFHLPIYSGAEYYSTVVGGVEITRTHRFSPAFTPLALGFILAMREWRPIWLAALAVNILAVMVSYTRTLLIAALVAVAIAIIVRELRHPEAGRLLRRGLAILGSIAVIVAAFAWMRPVEFGYLLARFGDFFAAGGASDIGNWRVREMQWSAVERVVSRIDPWFGLGFPEAGSNAVDSFIYLWTWDNTWLPILYRFGIAGLVVLGLLVICFAVRALRMALAEREDTSYFGLVFLITITMTAIMTLWGPTFMDPVITLGFWSFAFVTAEATRPKEAVVQDAQKVTRAGPAATSIQR